MIKSFNCRETEKIFRGIRSKKFQNSELSPTEFPSPKDTVVVKADITIEKKMAKNRLLKWK